MTTFPVPPCESPCKLTVEMLYFYKAVHAHRRRLFGLYELIQNEIPEMFEPWRGETHLIKSYLFLHDLPKVQPLSKLKSYGYSSPHTLCCRLGQFFGKNKCSMTLEEQNFLEAAIGDLNEVERQQKDRLIQDISAFWDKDKIKEFGKFITWLERVIDVTDTELWRGEELGRKPILFGATQFLENRGEKKAAELSFQIETLLNDNPALATKITLH